MNDTRDVKDDNAVGLADGIAQRACTAVVEIGYMVDGSPASASGKAAEPLCSGKGQKPFGIG